MGVWKEIGKALNSTLGTSKFQSLDKMIMGSKGLVESDNLYLNTGIRQNFENTLDAYESIVVVAVKKIKTIWGGSIRLDFVATTNQTSSERVKVFIKKNNKDIYVSGYFSGSTLPSPLNVSEILAVQPDDIIEIGFYYATGAISGPIQFNSAISDVKIYADLIDTSGISIK